MARRASYRKRTGGHSSKVSRVLAAFVVVSFALFFGLGVAQGEGNNDDSTLGIGEVQNTVVSDSTQTQEADDLLQTPEVSVSDTAVIDGQRVNLSTPESLTVAQQRTFTVEDPEPTVVLAAVDTGDPNTVAVAATIGTTAPMPTAQRLRVDTSGDEWLTGVASAYDVASSSTLTYSGRAFDDDCVTVAVPQGMEEYVGRPVEIVWNDQVVIATVTDTGGFAKYGRCLDLGGGVWKAFGCEEISDWGLQTVKYRYL
ncbi:MAG: hypothetical protein J5804_03970 [Eggerthellaceae bacterium]|nr:hypothetical protein [Eggerthellaceae bacterium]